MFARVLQFIYQGVYTYALDATNTEHGDATITALGDLLASGKDDLLYLVEEDEDSDKSIAVLDLEVYDLADKYGIPKLKTFSLEELVDSVVRDGADLLELFQEHYPARTNQDENLKEALAKCIALNYRRLRSGCITWEDGIGVWLKEDFGLCTMVMDQLQLRSKRS